MGNKLPSRYTKDLLCLIHIEVQGDADEDFSQRMFLYFYRIFSTRGAGDKDSGSDR